MKKRGFRLLAFILCSLMTLSFCSCFGFLKNAFEQGVQYKLSDDGEYSIAADYKGWNGTVEILSVYQGKPVREIGDEAFSHCYFLNHIIIPDSITSIGNKAFFACRTLRDVIIPDSVTRIGNYAFSSCLRLKEIHLPDSITELGDGVFSSCSDLETVNLPQGLPTVPNHTFYENSNLSNVTLPASITQIGNSAFYECDNLREFVIPDEVTSIHDYAFYDCTKLTRVIVGKNLTYISQESFYRCDRLLEVVNYSEKMTDVQQGSTTKGYLGYYAKDVYNHPTSYQSKISEENGYWFYTDGADTYLLDCFVEDNVVIPSGVSGIYDCAFYENAKFSSITIPVSVTHIGASAFLNSYNYPYQVIYEGDLTDWCNINFVGSFANPINPSAKFYLGDTLVTDLIFPDTVTSIPDFAFNGFSGVTKVVIPNSVSYIGSQAFSSCENLTSVTIAKSVTAINSHAFYFCIRLTDITYEGTMAEWNAIQKASSWASYTDLEKVICNDGEVNL